ncbi:sulfatase [Rubritalea sp.]|uniref:sulfatase n=1 Tax=Rubritalea sp. TaxID=2109375 RepID=UPI003EF38CA9
MRRLFLSILTLSTLAVSSSAIAQSTRPNVLIFFIDDLGWADIGANGSTFHETPNIDALAKTGANFKNSYAANPVCSPTRAALMTGKAPQRVGITQWIPTGSKIALPLTEVTIGEAFQEAGYRTGYIGKWHLGKSDDVQPQFQGFGYTAAVNRAGQPASFFYPFGKRKGGSSVPDLGNYKKGDYLTDALTDLAIDFIDTKSEEPFFLCLSHYAVHTPIQAPEDLVKKYQTKKEKMYGGAKPKLLEDKYGTMSTARQEDPAYAAMMENLDTNIGRVMEHIESKGMLENTIVVFSSDNGGLAHRKQTGGPTSNAPLRSGKAWTYEGGIRIPTIMSWQGKISPVESNQEIITMDVYPTLLDLCGLPLKPEQHLDGVSLKKVLAGNSDKAVDGRFLAWTYPHIHGNGHKPSSAIQIDGWKLIKFSEGKPYELYKLSDDIGEKMDLSDQYPERVSEMDKKLEKWISETTPKSSK